MFSAWVTGLGRSARLPRPHITFPRLTTLVHSSQPRKMTIFAAFYLMFVSVPPTLALVSKPLSEVSLRPWSEVILNSPHSSIHLGIRWLSSLVKGLSRVPQLENWMSALGWSGRTCLTSNCFSNINPTTSASAWWTSVSMQQGLWSSKVVETLLQLSTWQSLKILMQTTTRLNSLCFFSSKTRRPILPSLRWAQQRQQPWQQQQLRDWWRLQQKLRWGGWKEGNGAWLCPIPTNWRSLIQTAWICWI